MRIEIKTNAAASHLSKIRNELTALCDTLRTEMEASILDSDAVSQLIGDTNAADWRVNVFEVDVLVLLVFESGIKLRFQFQASGEQDEEKMMYGDKIEGQGTVVVYWDDTLVLLSLTAALVEPPAERDGEEEAINNCEPDDDGPDEDDDGPDEDDDGPAERDGEEEAINNCEPDDDGPDEDDDHEPEDEPKKLS